MAQIDQYAANLQCVEAAAAKRTGVGSFQCPLSVAQVGAAVRGATGIQKFHQDGISCTFLTGSPDAYLGGRAIRLEIDRSIGALTAANIDELRSVASSVHCQFAAGMNPAGPTGTTDCLTATNDYLQVVFDSSDQKANWTYNLTYGAHVAHSANDLGAGMRRLLIAAASG